jgi:hypothetical protein
MVDTSAPHGRDESGTPLAPYGLNLDGTPRKSNRGARPGQRGNAGSRARKSTTPSVSQSNLSDQERKEMLCELSDMVLVTPLASASMVPWIHTRIGAQQADALAGDALILNHFAPMLADGLLILAKTKPRALSWLDKVEENAPFLLLTNALIQVAKAVAANHINPDPRMAEAGRSLAAMRMARVAEKVQQEAEGYARAAAAATSENE